MLVDTFVFQLLRIGPVEAILILVVVLLIFGPGRLPKLAKSIGDAVRIFKSSSEGSMPEEEESSIKKTAEELGIETKGKSSKELAEEIAKKYESE
jgi:TatA/E family protein of Tat protein translocase